MRWIAAAGWLAIGAACSGSPATGTRAADAPSSQACRAGEVTACLAETRPRCAAGTARRLRYGGLPPVTIGPHGLVRLDHLGGQLFATDATRWLACFEACPGGGPERVCFPLALPLRVAWSPAAGCDRQTRAAPPFRGQATQVLELSCADGGSELRHAPALDPVRRDLVRAGVIEERDVLASLDGLVVEMSSGGAVESALEEIEPAPCEAFDLPPGYRVIGDAGAFGALEEAAAPPAAALAEAVEKVRAEVALEAVRRAKAELLPVFRAQHGEACRHSGRDPAVDAELEACAAAIPTTEAPFRAAVARETRRLLAARRAELDALTRELLVGPLCRHYAGRVTGP